MGVVTSRFSFRIEQTISGNVNGTPVGNGEGVGVSTQGLQNTLPRTCTNHLDPTSCFFPQNIISQVMTPLYILNSAFDSWQIGNSLAPPSADSSGSWHDCSFMFRCNAAQKKVLEGK
ncbi:hypothetical protein DY000_02044835 [Brassica cretica]|uniref:Pectin acetylesterase n=1 Tax=Brassica cretica TaxID=69181 RepID=A0ABQ7F1Q5_BRACR|nr:hypothetical protein DY000_02044835 [Brassica cretica]